MCSGVSGIPVLPPTALLLPGSAPCTCGSAHRLLGHAQKHNVPGAGRPLVWLQVSALDFRSQSWSWPRSGLGPGIWLRFWSEVLPQLLFCCSVLLLPVGPAAPLRTAVLQILELLQTLLHILLQILPQLQLHVSQTYSVMFLFSNMVPLVTYLSFKVLFHILRDDFKGFFF